MEVKFNKQLIQCLLPYHQVLSQEQTQELRLPDGYPDIGRVLGCWGEALIREKEWRGNSMSASGGVMAWVLYAPEDSGVPQMIETWIPFQSRWDFPEFKNEVKICLLPRVSGIDARAISARKLMLRTHIEVMGQAFSKTELEIPTPMDLPKDVQLLKRTYPMEMPMEAGEKQISLDETIPLAGVNPPIYKIVHYQMHPELTEQKIIGNRLVYRGACILSVVYMSEDGSIHNWKTEIPFSQYVELDRDFDMKATAWILPMMTALEVSIVENQELHVQAGFAVQYTVYQQNMIEIVEDVYSPNRDITIKMDDLQIPALLDDAVFEIPIECCMNENADSILDIVMLTEYPSVQFPQQDGSIRLDGQMQVLYQKDGITQQDIVHFKENAAYAMESDNSVVLWPGTTMPYVQSQKEQGLSFATKIPIATLVYSGVPMHAVSELEIGELKEPDAKRPAMIIRRADGEDLWTIAKACGSRVDIIRQANELVDEPSQGQMLLIPIP